MNPDTGHLYEFAIPPELAPQRSDIEAFNIGIDAAKAFLATLPDSRAKSLALTKLDEAVLWTTQAMGNRMEGNRAERRAEQFKHAH